jgi:hypothetical protein
VTLSEPEIIALMEDAPRRYTSVRAVIRSGIDHDAAERALDRHADEPPARSLLRHRDPGRRPSGIRETSWRAWYARPAFHREEEYSPSLGEHMAKGGDGRTTWQAYPRTGRVRSRRDRSIAVLRPGPWVRALASLDHPIVSHWFHPRIGNMLEPKEIVLQAGLDLHHVGEATEAGRPAHRVEARVHSWPGDGFGPESLWPAGDHELRLDAETGILLRVANSDQAREFYVTEITQVDFDERLAPELFAPPRPR